MKKTSFLISITLLLMSFGCASERSYDKTGVYRVSSDMKELILKAEDRGYVTLYEWQFIKQKATASSIDWVSRQEFWAIDRIVHEELLPYKGMFYLALEKENYQEADCIKENWIGELKFIYRYVLKNHRGFVPSVNDKVAYQINKLENIIGLSDPMLITLRKELSVAINNKDWDKAHKIQYLISAKTNDLRPSQTYRGQTGGTVIVQQPSRIQVEQVPRYGAEDLARAMSLLSGQGGQLTDEETGALRLFDILLKR